jgi:hypothetical protein
LGLFTFLVSVTQGVALGWLVDGPLALLRVPRLAAARQKVAQLVQAQRDVARGLGRLRVGHQQAFANFQTALEIAPGLVRVTRLAAQADEE